MQTMTEWGRGHVNPGVGNVGLSGKCWSVAGPFFRRCLAVCCDGQITGCGMCENGRGPAQGLLLGRYDGGAADEVFLAVFEFEAYPAGAAFLEGLEVVVGTGCYVEACARGEVVKGNIL